MKNIQEKIEALIGYFIGIGFFLLYFYVDKDPKVLLVSILGFLCCLFAYIELSIKRNK